MFPGTVLNHPKCFLHCNALPWLGGEFIPEMVPSRQCTWDCMFMIPSALYSSLMLSWQDLPSLAQPYIFPATFKGTVTHMPNSVLPHGWITHISHIISDCLNWTHIHNQYFLRLQQHNSWPTRGPGPRSVICGCRQFVSVEMSPHQCEQGTVYFV